MSTRATRSRAAASSPARAPAAAASTTGKKRSATAAAAAESAPTKKRATTAASTKRAKSPVAKRGRSPAAEDAQSSPAKKPRARAKSQAPPKSSRARTPSPSRSRSRSRARARTPSPSRSRSRSASPAMAAKAMAEQVKAMVRSSVAAAARQAASTADKALRDGRSRSRSRSRSPSVARATRSRSRSVQPVSRSKPASRASSRARTMAPVPAPAPVEKEPVPVVPETDSRSASESESGSGSEESESEGEDEPAAASASTPRRPVGSSFGSAADESNFGVSRGTFSPHPSQGGIKVMPRTSTFPTTPAGGRGRATLLRDVEVPPAIFLSPFPVDVRAGHRKSAASTKGWEGQGSAVPEDDKSGDESGSESDEETQQQQAQQQQPAANGVPKAKQLRPTSAQEAAESARARPTGPFISSSLLSNNGAAGKKNDTPTVNRARSRLAGSTLTSADEGRQAAAAIKEDAEENETPGASSTPRRASSRRQSQDLSSGTASSAPHPASLPAAADQTKAVRGGLVRTVDATWPFTLAALLLLLLAHVLLWLAVSAPGAGLVDAQGVRRSTTGPVDTDVLGVRAASACALKSANTFLAQRIAPLLPPALAPYAQVPAAVAQLAAAVDAASAQYYLAFLAPLLYILAGFVVKKGYELTARDAVLLAPAALDQTALAQTRHARNVFVACHAFVAAISFWVFWMAAEKFDGKDIPVANVAAPAAAAAAAAPGAAAAAAAAAAAPVLTALAPVFSLSWYATLVIVTSLGWSLSELLNFAPAFSPAHTALWALAALASEFGFWSLLPAQAIALLPPVMQKCAAFLALHIQLPVALHQAVAIVPLLVLQAAESLKALAGLLYTPAARAALLAVPAAFMFGLRLFVDRVDSQSEAWVAALALLVSLALLSLWECAAHTAQIVVPKARVAANKST